MSEAELTDSLTGVAIIGMSGRFPGAPTLEAFWRNLCDGVESVTLFADEDARISGVDPRLLGDPRYVKARAVLDGVEQFDAAFFGYTPHEAAIIDPQQRLFLECAWAALEHAGYDAETYTGTIGLYGGAAMNYYLLTNLYPNREVIGLGGEIQAQIGNDKDHLTTRVAYKLNLTGPSVTVQTACSTALVAVCMACQSLLGYHCDMALAGGVSLGVPGQAGYLYQEGGIGSPDGHCRAFDAQGQGTVGGDGVGVVVLKRLEDALADGDTIHAVIMGFGINNDGAAKAGYTAPSVQGQTQAIAAAHAIAGIDPATISYVEAHGTATALGDPIEIAALTQAFRAGTDQTGFCAIGSVKTNIGHLNTAAGIAGLIKTVLALKHKRIPPSLHFHQPNPAIDFAGSPFYVNTRLAAWRAGATPRRAGVSSFGMGGTNAHVVLEEAPAVVESEPARPWQLLLLSAKTATALDAATANLAAYLDEHPGVRLADVAYTLQVGRRAFDHRRAILCRDGSPSRAALSLRDPQQLQTQILEPQERPIVFMFPGQGAQYVNMARELHATEPVFREQVDRCAELLLPHLGLDLREVLYSEEQRTKNKEQNREHQPEEPRTKNQEPTTDYQLPTTDHRPTSDPARPFTPSPLHTFTPSPLHPFTPSPAHPPSFILDLEQTQYAQPALFVVGYALAQQWLAWGVRPWGLIGHSLGEYVAACLAGVFSLEDALELVALRGRLMQDLPPGAMLAVSLPEDETRTLLDQSLALAAINGPSLCVVSGPADAIDALRRRLAERDVDCRLLHTSRAFHSAMMDPIVEPFMEQVRNVRLHPPRIAYVSNVTGTWITVEQATDPRYWARHLRAPVRFSAGLQTLLKEAAPLLLEVGPGQTLSRLARRHPAATAARAVLPSLAAEASADEAAQLLTAAGQLWLAGVALEWPCLTGAEQRRVALPPYPFERQRYWIAPRQERAAPRPALERAAAAGKQADLAQWFFQPVWRRRTLPHMRAGSETARHWVVLGDGGRLEAELLARLRAAGHVVTLVRAGAQFARDAAGDYTINPRARSEYAALIEELYRVELQPAGIIHLWSLTSQREEPAGAARFAPAQERGFYSLLFLAQALAARESAEPLQIEVVTNRALDVSGEELSLPEKATLAGPCKIIPQEHPNIVCRCIDIVVPEAETRQEARLIDRLVTEFAAESSDMLVAYRGDQRWAQTFEPIRLERDVEPVRPLRENGVYLISGGLGGIGMLLAEYLARTVRARLILAGRSALPERDSWQSWLATHDEQDGTSRKIRSVRAIEQLGAEVLVVSADVADVGQMRSLLARIDDRFGELNGVLHAAGITSGSSLYSPLTEISPADAETQFRPKVHGLYTLEQVLQGRAIDFCLLFSSNASVLGGLGFFTYAAANLFMDAFASSRSKTSSIPWISASWDPWPEETRKYTGFQTSMDQYTMTSEESLEALTRVVTTAPEGQIVVATGDLPARLDRWIRRGAAQAATGSIEGDAAAHPRPQLQSTYVAPNNETEQAIVEIWQQILGIEQVGIHDNFFDLGGHSLLATRLLARLRGRFHVDLPIRTFFETPTPLGLARLLDERQSEQVDQETLDILSMLAQLSEEETEAEIRKRMQVAE